MAMSLIWTAMVGAAILCGLATGNGPAVARGALDGAAAGVELCLSMMGELCWWMGVMEVMERSGLARGLSRVLRPAIRGLYPDFARDSRVMDAVSANLSANLLGLGNAATPLGLEATPGGRPAHGGADAWGGLRRAVYAGGVQYGLLPAHPHHGGLPALGGGERRPLRHPARGVAGVGGVHHGGGDGGQAVLPLVEVRGWI